MTGNRKMKKQNFIAKNSLQVIGLVFLFVATLLKWIFMHYKMESGQGIYLTIFIFFISITAILALTLREVVAKAVTYRKSRGQYKNALRIMKTAAGGGFVLGLLMALIFTMVAGRMTHMLFDLGSYGTFPLIVFATTLPFVLLIAVLIGSFDGFDFSMPLGATQIIFAVTDLIVSLLLIVLACNMGQKHGALLHDTTVVDVFGATGAAGGFLLATMFSALWLLVLFKAFRRKMRNSISEDGSRSQENFADQIRGLMTACGMPVARNLSLYGPILINEILFFQFYKMPATFSVYYAPVKPYMAYIQSMLWFVLPIGLIFVFGKYSQDYLKKIMKKDDMYHCGMRIILNIKLYLTTIFPMICVIGICMGSLQNTLFATVSGKAWMVILVVITLTMSYLCLSILTALGKEWIGIIAGLSAFAIQSVAAILLSNKECYTVEQILWWNLIYGVIFLVVCMTCLNSFCVYKKHLSNHLVMPLVAAFATIITAILCMFLKTVIGDILAVILAMILAMIVHMLTLIVTGCIKENELSEYPQGIFLEMIGKFMGIYS